MHGYCAWLRCAVAPAKQLDCISEPSTFPGASQLRLMVGTWSQTPHRSERPARGSLLQAYIRRMAGLEAFRF
jgi:hypothetical protein